MKLTSCCAAPCCAVLHRVTPCCAVPLQLKEETARLDEEEAEVDRHNKEVKQSEKQWESTRESRVGTWQSFVKTKGGKKATGELKPPKQKTHDEDRLFVQRPVGEQFRPPPPGANPPKQ